jgi:hypothetical protein
VYSFSSDEPGDLLVTLSYTTMTSQLLPTSCATILLVEPPEDLSRGVWRITTPGRHNNRQLAHFIVITQIEQSIITSEIYTTQQLTQ